MMEGMRVLIIDDDDIVTMSLEMILGEDPDLQVVGKGGSGAEAIELYSKLQPDILLMDIRMGDMTGVDAAEQILNKDKDAKILFLTTFSDDEYIIRALQLGVKGYLLKQDYQSIPVALKSVCNGQNVFGGAIVSKLPDLMERDAAAENDDKPGFDYEACGITSKEYEVIQLVAEGLSNKEIADKIFLSEGTVKNYISTILDKLDLRDRTQLAIFYLKG